MLFFIATALAVIGIQTDNLVWFIAAALAVAIAFWQRGEVKQAGIALLVGAAIFVANGGDLSGFVENPILGALVVLALTLYGFLRVFGLKWGRKGGGM